MMLLDSRVLFGGPLDGFTLEVMAVTELMRADGVGMPIRRSACTYFWEPCKHELKQGYALYTWTMIDNCRVLVYKE